MGGEDKFDFLRVQSAALPTELPGHIEPHDKIVKKRNYSKNSPFYLPPGSYWLIHGSPASSPATEGVCVISVKSFDGYIQLNIPKEW